MLASPVGTSNGTCRSSCCVWLLITCNCVFPKLFEFFPLLFSDDHIEIELFSCLEYLSLGFLVAIMKAFVIEVGSVTRLSTKVYPLLVSHDKLGLTPRKLGVVSLDEQHQGGHGDINKITGCAVSVNIF